MELKLLNVTKSFGGFRALDNISLRVPAGSLVAVLGPSGSGKTTLLRVVAGLERVDRGQVLLGETDITASPPQRRNMGMVFQHYALFDHLNVFENVAFGLRVRRLPREEVRSNVFENVAFGLQVWRSAA